MPARTPARPSALPAPALPAPALPAPALPAPALPSGRPAARTAGAAAGALLLVLLSACGGGSDAPAAATPSADASSSAATTSTPPSAGAARHNEADLAFVRDMVPHHRGAVSMADLARDRAADPRVVQLAERIRAAQQPEIDLMTRLASSWGESLDGPTGGAGHGGGGHGAGSGASPGADPDVAALTPLRGAAFDREFLRRMTEHHRGAVEMAQQELARGVDPQARRLAQEIVRVQEAEIREMAELAPR